jgi:tetratricopeptide (TPR) repeat protein
LSGFPESLQDVCERIRRNRNDAKALQSMALMLAARGEYRRSYVCHRAAATCSPEDPKMLFDSASAALALGRADDAAWYLEKTLSIDPNHAEAWRKRGDLFSDHLNRPDEAMRSYTRAIELAPQDTSAYQSAARCILRERQPAAAIACLRDIGALHADRGVALALAERGRYEEAAPILCDILCRQPADHTSMRVLAELYTGLHDWSAARHWFERAIAEGNGPMAMIGMVMHWTRLGDFARARHEYRTHLKGAPFDTLWRQAAPRWQGENISGKTVRLLAGDIYFGDAIQYVRFARILKQAGAKVVLQVPKRLRFLLNGVEGVDSAVAPYDRLPPIDYDSVAFWMLYALDLPVDQMIGGGPYLHAPAALRAEWANRIVRTPAIHAGIVWHGSSYLMHDRFASRSMRLEELRPLTGIPGVKLYSLQCGEGRAQLLNAAVPFPAVDLAPDFANTAAAMEALDVVITIDTSVAHLAGAMGKRTFVMLPYNACGRWMTGRDDTPWYRGMRLFRQTRPGEWADVVNAVAQALGR